MTLIDQIRDMISEGETEKSLEELYTYVKENNADIIDQLVMLRNRNRNLQRSVQMGTMDSQDAGIERAKINEAILKLLPQLTPEYLAQASKKREPIRPPAAAAPLPPPPAAAPNRVVRPAAAPTESKSKYYLIGGGATFLLLLLIGLCNGGEESTSSTYVEPTTEESAAPTAQYTNSAPATFQQSSTLAENNLINRMMREHNGYAVWQVNNGANETTLFHFEGNSQCSEIKGGAIVCVWQVNEITYEDVSLYDPQQETSLLLTETEAYSRGLGETEWNPILKGQWITPNR